MSKDKFDTNGYVIDQEPLMHNSTEGDPQQEAGMVSYKKGMLAKSISQNNVQMQDESTYNGEASQAW